MASRSSASRPCDLFIFDFDRTIVDEDSYTEIAKLFPGELPQAVTDLLESDGWPEYMNEVLNLLHETGVPADIIRDRLKRMRITFGFVELFEYLQEQKSRFHAIILSDANQFFIDTVLHSHKLNATFLDILTNPAELKSSGRLQLGYYHNQTSCNNCPENMCKGEVLTKWLQAAKLRGQNYSRLFYFGDAEADFCPIKIVLKPDDYAFGRKDHPLGSKLANERETLRPHVEVWSDGLEILEKIKQLYP